MIADIKSDIMAHLIQILEQNSPEIENHLREKRQSAGLSQKQLADMAGITRQAVSAVEANQYSPATSVALQLARALRCRVEDLFSIKSGGEIIEGELIGVAPSRRRKASGPSNSGWRSTPGPTAGWFWRVRRVYQRPPTV